MHIFLWHVWSLCSMLIPSYASFIPLETRESLVFLIVCFSNDKFQFAWPVCVCHSGQTELQVRSGSLSFAWTHFGFWRVSWLWTWLYFLLCIYVVSLYIFFHGDGDVCIYYIVVCHYDVGYYGWCLGHVYVYVWLWMLFYDVTYMLLHFVSE